MSGEIDGRDEELRSIYVFLDQAVDGPAALVLEGEAGIGKSTLWQAGVEAARERGLRVLLSRPAEAERGLTHPGLGDLFENVLESVLPAFETTRLEQTSPAITTEKRGRASPPFFSDSHRCAWRASGEVVLPRVVDRSMWRMLPEQGAVRLRPPVPLWLRQFGNTENQASWIGPTSVADRPFGR
jgi:hypothetical protein